MKGIDEDIVKGYLIGGLSEGDQEYVEEHLFDKNVLQLCDLAESELIDDYVFRRLSVKDRHLFETNFLTTPVRLQKVKAVQLASWYASKNKSASGNQAKSSSLSHLISDFLHSPKLAWSFVLLTVLVGSFLLVQSRHRTENLLAGIATEEAKQQEIKKQLDEATAQANRDEGEIARLRTELQNSNAERDRLNDLSSKRNIALPATITLHSTGSRGGGSIPVLSIRKGIELINLRLPINRRIDGNAYRVIIRNENDKQAPIEISGFKSVRDKEGESVIIAVPSSQISSGEYVVILQAKTKGKDYDDIDAFPIRVKK